MFFDVAHLPLEFFLVEIGHIMGDELFEEIADGVECELMLLEVELKGTEGYSTVVEGGHGEVALASDCGLFDVGKWVQGIPHIKYKKQYPPSRPSDNILITLS
jgi:hypothetical protein